MTPRMDSHVTEDLVMKDANELSESEVKNVQFTNLPHELLSEIAKRLHPLDLIHLARVNKLLRAIFLDPSTAEIWRATLTNAGVPPCPDDNISEPEYSALLFLKQCTECDEPASRHVDPIFLVRPCSSCRKYIAMTPAAVGEMLQPYLSRSQYLVPPKGIQRRYWYMRYHYEEVDETYRELLKDNDISALNEFWKGRRKVVQEWDQKTKPLAEWVDNREKEYKLEMNKLKLARRTEVESRLIQLDWEQADVKECFYFLGEARAMVYKPKPLDDAEWNDMLPNLFQALETARRHRLRMEADKRKSDYEEIIEKWFKLLPDQLGPMDLRLRRRDSTDNVVPSPIDILCTRRCQKGVEKQDVMIRIPSLPPYRYVLKWLPIEVFVSKDRPKEEFQLEFEGKLDYLKEQFSGWRSNLEASLVQALPQTMKPVETQSSQFNLEVVHTKDSTVSSNALSGDLRVLLRADVIFKYDHKPVYYPNAFTSWTIDARTPVYDPASSSVARAILNTLQHPDASYMEMKSLGQSFVCERCTSDPAYLTWKAMVSHFVYEQERWQSATQWNERYREEGGGITLMFTHDTTDTGKPLVKLVAEPDRIISPKAPQTECKVCLSIGQHYRTGLAHIVNHIQATHSIESPVRGEHYT